MRIKIVFGLATLVVAAPLGIPQSAHAAPTGMPAAVRATLHKIKAQYGQKQPSRRHGSGETGECGSLTVAPAASSRLGGKQTTIVYAEDIINAPDCD